MKFVCDGPELSESITKVSKALNPKPIDGNHLINCIKIDAYENVLTLTAMDGEITILRKMTAEVLEEGSVCVPGQFIVDFIRRLSNEQIEFTLLEKYRMRIRYTGSEVFVQCFSCMDYPEFKTLLEPKCVKILGKELKELIQRSAFCVSNDNARAVLKGSLITVYDYIMTAVSLDGYRLIKISKPTESKSEKFSAIIPGRPLSEIAKLIGNDEEIVGVYFEKDYVMFDFEHTKILIRLLSGEFINYEQIIPKEFCTDIVINRQAFLKSLDRAGVLSKTDLKTSIVTMLISENVMTLSGNSDLGNITEKIDIKMTGKDIKIAYNVRFLLDFLGTCEDEFIRIRYASPIAPCIITPVEERADNSFFYLVIPVRMAA